MGHELDKKWAMGTIGFQLLGTTTPCTTKRSRNTGNTHRHAGQQHRKTSKSNEAKLDTK